MCGIGGIFRNDIFSANERGEVYRIISKLLVGLQSRGTSATGIALINTKSDTVKVYKAPIKASKFIKKQKFRKELMKNTYNMVLVHTRAPTVGNPKYSYNNHPIYDIKNNNVLVHNGGITNYESLRKKYSIKGEAEVDSEVILAMYNYRNKNIKEALKELAGGLAIALYDNKKLYLYSNRNPLNITWFKNKKTWIFSSEEEYIEKSVTKSEKTTDYEIFEFEERLKGYEVYSNYDFDNKDFAEIDFVEKEPFMVFEKNVESLGWVSCGHNYTTGKDLEYQNRVNIKRMFNSGRANKVDCDSCNSCLVRFCPDRYTDNAVSCRRPIVEDMIELISDNIVKVKDIGYLRKSIFQLDKINAMNKVSTNEDDMDLIRGG